MEITKEEFKEYAKVQESGLINMMDSSKVCLLSELDKNKVLFIMKNYSKLKEQFASEVDRE